MLFQLSRALILRFRHQSFVSTFLSYRISRRVGQAYEFKNNGRLELCEDLCQKILLSQPQNPDANYLLGLCHAQRRDFQLAEYFFRQAIHGRPLFPESFNALGNIYALSNRPGDAISNYRKADGLQPHSLGIQKNLSMALANTGEHVKAKQILLSALEQSHDPELYFLLANIDCKLGQFETAIRGYNDAIQRGYTNADVLNNLGFAEFQSGRLDLSVSHYREAIKVRPDFANAHFNLSATLLCNGQFQDGWSEYEWRLKTNAYRYSNFPLWNGEPLHGKRLLVHAEQGLGDTLLFARYLTELKQFSGKILFECPPELFRLLSNIAGPDSVRLQGNTNPEDIEVQLPLLSLAHILRINPIEHSSATPYIVPERELVATWRNKLQPDPFRVGLVWLGNKNRKDAAQRNIPFEDLSSLFEISSINFYSLQMDNYLYSTDQDQKLIDLTDEISDFADTAALIENLDLVITIDTSVAHLAAAMNKPTWVLTPTNPDWRWEIAGVSSPWYQSVKIYRKTNWSRWVDIIDKVRSDLIALTA